MQWKKYPLRYASWIFIPLRRPPICPSYPNNICGVSLPEAFLLSTSISGGYSNSSCSSARSLFLAVLSCNPYFFCRGCKTARSNPKSRPPQPENKLIIFMCTIPVPYIFIFYYNIILQKARKSKLSGAVFSCIGTYYVLLIYV